LSYLTDAYFFGIQNQIKSNQILFNSAQKVDQRAGQLCLPHIGITKIEKNRTKT